MSTSAIGSNTSSNSTNKTTGSSTSGLGNYNVDASDFLNMMLTQLENQDPENPTDSSQLLTQMSQIGQLQASTTLQSTLKTLQLQSTLGSAGNLIGKNVEGLNDSGADVTGVVNSVKVVDGSVYCELDSGDSVSMSNITNITASTTAATGTSTGTPVASK
jgi:flagellar basal-body rod modification protein FlgD